VKCGLYEINKNNRAYATHGLSLVQKMFRDRTEAMFHQRVQDRDLDLYYHKTSNKCPPLPRHLLEHGLQNPRRLLENGVYSRPGVYKNTGLKPPESITCYNTGYNIR